MVKRFIAFLCLLLGSYSCIPAVKTMPPEQSSLTADQGYPAAYVIRDNINVRVAGSPDAEKITVAMDGDEVHILQNKNGWYEIINAEKIKGWIRSDFVGPKSLSNSLRSAEFTKSRLKAYNAEMMIDKTNPYAVVYLVLADKYYTSKNAAEKIAKEIGDAYQKDVYAGQVEIRILKQDKQNLFSKVILSKKGTANLKAPLLEYGRIFDLEVNEKNQLKIQILIPPDLNDNSLLALSEQITTNYAKDISKIEIFYAEDSADGIKYFSNSDYNPANKKVCRFYYMEDSDGPLWESGFCQQD
jgi:uncharacterized protein YgiM (DUF1202 family)